MATCPMARLSRDSQTQVRQRAIEVTNYLSKQAAIDQGAQALSGIVVSQCDIRPVRFLGALHPHVRPSGRLVEPFAQPLARRCPIATRRSFVHAECRGDFR